MSNDTKAYGVAARLWQRRNELRLSQMKLAMRCASEGFEIDPSAISRYETGRSKPHEDAIVGLALALNVSADWLLGLSSAKSRRP